MAVQQVAVEGVQLDEAHSKWRPGQVGWIHTTLAMKRQYDSDGQRISLRQFNADL